MLRFQPGRLYGGGDRAAAPAAGADRPVRIPGARPAGPVDPEAALRPVDAALAHAPQCRLADRIRLHVPVHEAVRAELERVHARVHGGDAREHGPAMRRLAGVCAGAGPSGRAASLLRSRGSSPRLPARAGLRGRGPPRRLLQVEAYPALPGAGGGATGPCTPRGYSAAQSATDSGTRYGA